MIAEKKSENGTTFNYLTQLTLRDYMLAALAACVETAVAAAPDLPENQVLQSWLDKVTAYEQFWSHMLVRYLEQPQAVDEALVTLAGQLKMSLFEMMCVVLAVAVEEDAVVGRVIAHLQAPLSGSRPMVGLISRALKPILPENIAASTLLLNGAAVHAGLLEIGPAKVPLPEKMITLPDHCRLALSSYDGTQPGMTIGLGEIQTVPLPESIIEDVQKWARVLNNRSQDRPILVIRSGSRAERRSAAQAVARELGLRPLFIETEELSGLTPWLLLRGLLPVYAIELAPGERKQIPSLPLYTGPSMVVTNLDGSIDALHENLLTWNIPVPPLPEREILWAQTLGENELNHSLARHHRHRSGRIAHLGRLARQIARSKGQRQPTMADINQAAWTAEGIGLENLAHPVPEIIPEEALIMTKKLKQELNGLFLRCQARDGLVEGLGISTITRYQPGVRALFVGPSGTGKTLAAGWLATKLGMPLFRVDMAAISSKYIGETEKNLAQLLAQAEQSEVILLFDEADALFGKRTEVQQANDRFANAQTNYLLQRMETFDGVVLLTSNSKSRFDSAFARRLDLIVEFPVPGPQERRKLWRSHLGDGHSISTKQLNKLAATADLTGGHIRNVVLAAAVLARAAQRPLTYPDIASGLASEYRKMNKQMPVELKVKAKDGI